MEIRHEMFKKKKYPFDKLIDSVISDWLDPWEFWISSDE